MDSGVVKIFFAFARINGSFQDRRINYCWAVDMINNIQAPCPEYENRLSTVKKLLDEVKDKISAGTLKKGI